MDLWRSTDAEAFTALVWLGMAVGGKGLESPSLRAIAGGRCSPGTLLNWFGSKRTLQRRVLGTLGVRWGHILTATLVPVAESDWFYARLRLAFEELARTDAELGAQLDELVQLEREIIAWWLASTHGCDTVEPRVLTVLHALLVRLWDARIHPDPRESLALLEEVMEVLIGKPVIERAYVRRAG